MFSIIFETEHPLEYVSYKLQRVQIGVWMRPSQKQFNNRQSKWLQVERTKDVFLKDYKRNSTNVSEEGGILKSVLLYILEFLVLTPPVRFWNKEDIEV